MRQVLAISITIFKTLWRKRLPFYGVIFLTIVFGAVSYFSPGARLNFSGFLTHIKISISMLLGIFLILAFGSGISLISEAFEDWSIHLIKVRPISGARYFLGCTLGLAFSITAVFLVVTFLSSFVVLYNYNELPSKEKALVSQYYRVAKLSYFRKAVDYDAQAELELKAEGSQLTSDQLFLRSRKLKVADSELQALAEKEFVFEGVTSSSETQFSFNLKISGDVFGVDRKFSQAKVIFKLPQKNISTFSLVKFESNKAVTIKIPSTAISSDGEVKIKIVNEDKLGRTFYFTSAEGPRLIQKGSGLLLNILKVIFLSIFNIILFSAGGLLLGLLFSSAVSFFFSFAYFTIAIFTDLGLFSDYVSSMIHFVFKSPFTLPFLSMGLDGRFISIFFLMTTLLTLCFHFLLLLATAHLIYSQREMAAVMRTR